MSTPELDAGAGHSPNQEILRLEDVGKSYGNVHALRGVSLSVRQGEITCVLGDNGAGKSTLIKIIAGLHQHTEGRFTVNGEAVRFGSPREALDRGIATVYQDLALVPLMSIWRNFFLGSELTRGSGPLRRLDVERMKRVTEEELVKMGISVPDLDRHVGALSGGQRQCIAIARAIHFGAKALVLDEPTAALGVKQSGVVLKYIAKARDAGLGVVFITHNPHHAHLVGNHFVILNRGRVSLDAGRGDVSLDRLTNEMAGGAELEALSHELSRPGSTPEPAAAGRTTTEN
ncbi:simple sugar transport system ATP-binding protein [Kineococcus xinjiangensis]|uniref:Simple sugar transport system ATP-binding protein n=1 Tax=Kineococcus xinjiangensis TaxID=512762 RepID=A0A2S6IUD0_9ACTN|nr:ATP-binding cassette domain-containing protein [Kineococcus xinjiangensis]PPK97871.1 simple sugar transport system ATP-binding protein [Kineococcus xinjiangensis]